MVVRWASETSNSTPVTQGPIKATSLNPSLAIQQLGTKHANKCLWGHSHSNNHMVRIDIQKCLWGHSHSNHHTVRTDVQIHTVYYVVLKTECNVSYMLDKCSTNERQLQTRLDLLLLNKPSIENAVFPYHSGSFSPLSH